MIYIKKIELINFQSHSHTEIEFDRGLNVILGNSDAGKTAILRAIKWALYNEPRGDYFIRQGEKDVSVKIVFSNGVVVERSRTPSKNSYYLLDAQGEEMRFEGFGLDVPKEITDATQMYRVSLDNSNNKSILNIAEQLDGPFLLNEQASLRASAIGRLIGVNYVDDALRTVVRDNKRINQEVEGLRSNRDNIKDQLKEYDYIKNYKEKFEKISEIREKIAVLNDKLNLASSLKERYDINSFEIEKVSDFIEKFSNVENIENTLPKIEANLIRCNAYESYLSKLNKTDSEAKILSQNLEKLNDIDILYEKSKEIEYKQAKLNSYTSLYKQYKSNTDLINKTKNNLDLFKNEERLTDIVSLLEDKISLYFKLYSEEEILSKVTDKLNYGYNYIKAFDNNINIEEISNELNEKIRSFMLLKDFSSNLEGIKNNYILENNNLKDIESSIKNYTESYENTILEIGVCPFCYSEINNESIEHIKYHLRND
ncbi:AAA family ATPase [Peptoniphilus harei]|uniref:AAA family ATPase n=1 Tax=Peptoniphilus harei TaxID=54005 RepID=UPI0029112CA4|nr:AAA family ATPase [Peptoniphilus harei]MDU6097632.1 AAA family ATPase [Peptoniphilus harei]